MLGRSKISLSQAGAKANESIEKHLFNTDENPTILDRLNRHKRCLDTRKFATQGSLEFKYSITLCEKPTVCLLAVGIFNYVTFIWNTFYFFFGGMPVN